MINNMKKNNFNKAFRKQDLTVKAAASKQNFNFWHDHVQKFPGGCRKMEILFKEYDNSFDYF